MSHKTATTIKLTTEETLIKIANISHHGSLIGYSNIYDAMREIRKLSIGYWDIDKCHTLQKIK